MWAQKERASKLNYRPTHRNSESQNAPDYSGVVHAWGNRRLVVSPTGRRYLVQEYLPEKNSFRNVHWAKTATKIAQRVPELMDLIEKQHLPEIPAKAAPATVAKRAAENKGAKNYPEFRCDYPSVIVQDGRIRITVSPGADAYLWQVATTYGGSARVRPNTWQNIYNAPSASELKGHLAEAEIIWPKQLDHGGKSAKVKEAIAELPERPQDVSWSSRSRPKAS